MALVHGVWASIKKIPHHSTFSKNRHGRFRSQTCAEEELFEQIVRHGVEVGLVQGGKHLSVDGGSVEANAAKSPHSTGSSWGKQPRSITPCDSICKRLEQQNPVEEPAHEQEQVSTTDPDSTYATKGGTPARLGYYDNYLVDNHSCVIVGVQATAARMSQETVAAQDMLTVSRTGKDENRNRLRPIRPYGNGEFLRWLAEREILLICGLATVSTERTVPFYGPERFTYQPEHNRYICPAGQVLNYGGSRNLEEPHLCLHPGPANVAEHVRYTSKCTSDVPLSCHPHG